MHGHRKHRVTRIVKSPDAPRDARDKLTLSVAPPSYDESSDASLDLSDGPSAPSSPTASPSPERGEAVLYDMWLSPSPFSAFTASLQSVRSGFVRP